MWFRKKVDEEEVARDINDAKDMQLDAKNELRELRDQKSYIAALTARLLEREALNNFGAEIQVTYTPRSS